MTCKQFLCCEKNSVKRILLLLGQHVLPLHNLLQPPRRQDHQRQEDLLLLTRNHPVHVRIRLDRNRRLSRTSTRPFHMEISDIATERNRQTSRDDREPDKAWKYSLQYSTEQIRA